MQFGRFEITLHNFGFLALDGGAMFGSVPKTMWQKLIPADDRNRIRLATHSLIVRDGTRTFLIDIGCGDKWSDKLRDIYGIEGYLRLPSSLAVTDIILTHLHFDHAGGISERRAESISLAYPHARVHVQRANLHNAQAPSVKERASYLAENVDVLLQANLELIDGNTEIAPGIFVHRVDGHTVGQQWIEIQNGSASIMFATDLIPTTHHLPLPYHMGYDQCASSLFAEKERFLSHVEARNAIVVFQHDAATPAARLARNKKGNMEVVETISFGPIGS